MKFTDIAKGDETGVDKINKNFDMAEQALNQEERKEVVVPLNSDWKVSDNGSNNQLKLIITQGGGWLTGDVQSKATGSSAFGNPHPIAKLPSEVVFRGTTYQVVYRGFFLAPIGNRVNSGGASAVRIYLNDQGYLIVDESQDIAKGSTITIWTYLDLTRKG